VIRLWKLDAGLRSFALLRTLSAPGFVNSLQLIRPPPGSLEGMTWLRDPEAVPSVPAADAPLGHINGDDQIRRKIFSRRQDILLVAGIGQEPRLGRWLQLKGNDVRNGAVVFALTRAAHSTTAASA